MTRNRVKFGGLAALLLIGNVAIAFLLAYLVDTFFNYSTEEFNRAVLAWHETGEYPFPDWLLWLVPRLGAWPASTEAIFQLSLGIAWAANGHLIGRYAQDTVPLAWIWAPVVVNILLRDPLQLIIGSLAFYAGIRRSARIGLPT